MTHEPGLRTEHMLTSLFQPDNLLPAQYFATFRRKTYLEPERRLMLAVLEDAVCCFQKYMFARDTRGKARFRDAENWILEEQSDWSFSFNNICEVTGCDPDYLRQGLVILKERRLGKPPTAPVRRLNPRKKKTGLMTQSI